MMDDRKKIKAAVDGLAELHRACGRHAADLCFAEQVGQGDEAQEDVWDATMRGIREGIAEAHRARGISDVLDGVMFDVAHAAFMERWDSLNERLAQGGEA